MTRADFEMHAVICTHGRCDLLRRTLASLAEARRPERLRRLWVIENGSDAGAAAICRDMADALPVHYVHRAEQGKSKALQYALDAIGAGLVVFLDDDIRVNAELFEAYERAGLEHGERAFFGGPLRVDQEQSPPDWLAPELPASAVGWALDDPAKPIRKGCFLGANYGGFVRTLQRVGGYRAHLGVGSRGNPVGEEFEIQDRMLAAGVRAVYLPDAIVWHYVPRERCTPGWALRRNERVWFTNTMVQDEPPAKRLWWDVPPWMLRRLAWRWLAAQRAWLTPSAQRRFEIRKPFYHFRGVVRGTRHRHRLARGQGV